MPAAEEAGEDLHGARPTKAGGEDVEPRTGLVLAEAVEAPLQRGRHLVDPTVATVGGGDDVEAPERVDAARIAVELRNGEDPLGEDRQERILHLRGAARELLEADHLALRHAAVDGRRYQRAGRRPLGEQRRVVPRILDGVLCGGRRALDREGGVARDRRGQQLAGQRLRRTRLADQHQAAVGGERDDTPLDERARADELRGDLLAVAQHEFHHRRGREPPAVRGAAAEPRVPLRQPRQLVGVPHFGRRPLHRCRHGVPPRRPA